MEQAAIIIILSLGIAMNVLPGTNEQMGSMNAITVYRTGIGRRISNEEWVEPKVSQTVLDQIARYNVEAVTPFIKPM